MSPATFSAHCANRSARVTASSTGVRSVCHALGAGSRFSASATMSATWSLIPSRSPIRPPSCTGKRAAAAPERRSSSGASHRPKRKPNVVGAASCKNDRADVGADPWRSTSPVIVARASSPSRPSSAVASRAITIDAESTTSWVVSRWCRYGALAASSRAFSTSSSGKTGVPAVQPCARTFVGIGSLVAAAIAVAASFGMSPASPCANATAASTSAMAATRESSLQIAFIASVEKPG